MDIITNYYFKEMDFTKTCIVFLGGTQPQAVYLKDILQNAALCIAADSGADACIALGKTPDFLIGDLDSIQQESLAMCQNSNCEILAYPPEKDFTDGELAIQTAIRQAAKMGLDTVCLAGVVGNRFDHMLANLFISISLVKAGLKVWICMEHSIAHLFQGGPEQYLKIYGKKGDIISVLPVAGTVKGVTLEKLYYPLNNATIPIDKAVGTSNVMLDSWAIIRCVEGFLLVVQNFYER